MFANPITQVHLQSGIKKSTIVKKQKDKATVLPPYEIAI